MDCKDTCDCDDRGRVGRICVCSRRVGEVIDNCVPDGLERNQFMTLDESEKGRD